jgi:uncharacterized protein DUF4232
MSDVEDKLRETLERKAGEVPAHHEVPAGMTRRVRPRIAMNAIVIAGAAAVVVVGVVAALGAVKGSREDTAATGGPSGSTAPAACATSDLSALVRFEGAMGSREGSIQVTNDGTTTCTVEGRPALHVLDANDQEAADVTLMQVDATWQIDHEDAPAGWPTVTLAPGDAGSVRASWSNWCGDQGVTWALGLADGTVPVQGIDASTIPPCNGPGMPSIVQIGPFEPATDGA